MAPPLNPPQRDAVQTLRGPLLVLAGAGTGKTRVVTFRIAELIRHGTKPARILGVTFTNKAAREMQELVGGLLTKGKKEDKPELSTFHSLCVRILRRNIRALGYPERFAIFDSGDQESLARQVLREIRVDGALLKPSELLSQISSWKSRGLRPADASNAAETDKQHLAAMAYRKYQKALKTQGAVDFDDLLLLTQELFETNADVRRSEAARFDHILVDEYQDTNHTQYSIVKALALGHRNLCVVGDDDQSIYGWRGAEVQHILNFRVDWPEAKVVRLEDNYRSTAEILELANRLIRCNKTRYDKQLRASKTGDKPRIEQHETEEVEARWTVADIRRQLAENPGLNPRDFAILFRTNEQPRAFEAELRKHKVPYTLVGSQSFFDRKEVKDILAYLKVLAAPQDEVSLLRIINTPPRGISAKTVEALVGEAVKSGTSLWDVMPRAAEVAGITAAAAASVGRLVRIIGDYRQRLAPGKLTAAIRDYIGAVDYRAEIARCYDEEQERDSRLAGVEEIVNGLARYEEEARSKAKLETYLDALLLGERDMQSDKDDQLKGNAVALMTLHSAKGLEFPHVYMVGLEEGILPHHRSLGDDEKAVDEERRLCYVGITRARERLTMSLALSRMKWGKARPTEPSRFLFELAGVEEK
jgi:DNA helicase-2/ATP-dependent DNA helicase PcrA